MAWSRTASRSCPDYNRHRITLSCNADRTRHGLVRLNAGAMLATLNPIPEFCAAMNVRSSISRKSTLTAVPTGLRQNFRRGAFDHGEIGLKPAIDHDIKLRRRDAGSCWSLRQQCGRRDEELAADAAVDMHFGELLAVRLDVDQHRRKSARNAAGGEQHVAEQIERLASPPVAACAAMAPMFQTTERSASRSVVTTNSRRPRLVRGGDVGEQAGVICLAMRSLSGQESTKLSPVRADLENVGRGDARCRRRCSASS